MAVAVEGKKGVTVHVDHIRLRLHGNRTSPHQGDQFLQGLGTNFRGKVIQVCFQVGDLRTDEDSPVLLFEVAGT